MTTNVRTSYRVSAHAPQNPFFGLGSMRMDTISWAGIIDSVNSRSFCEDSPACDYVESVWDGDTLVKYRVIRLGTDFVRKCRECGGDGYVVMTTDDGGYAGQEPCSCQGVEAKPQPRDTNPPWTVVVTTDTVPATTEQTHPTIEAGLGCA